jgi:hypothetical protein
MRSLLTWPSRNHQRVVINPESVPITPESLRGRLLSFTWLGLMDMGRHGSLLTVDAARTLAQKQAESPFLYDQNCEGDKSQCQSMTG